MTLSATRVSLLALLVALLPLTGCVIDPLTGDDDDLVDDDDATGDDDDATGDDDDGPEGWIGGPCETDADCPYADAVCYVEDDGYPRGMCTQACDLYCPDEDGHPVTFCVTDEQLPADAPVLGDGACHSRCDFGFFPDSGCRTGYGCVVVTRANEPDTDNYACMPGVESELSACYAELAAAGVRFEPTVVDDDSPDGHPELICHVEDPVIVRPPIHDVDVVDSGGNASGLLAACEMAHALSDTALDVKDHGATEIVQLGTYNCRVISGTSTLSQHAHANAIDLWGFTVAGELYTLVDHWEHDTADPSTAGGQWLYRAAHRWHDDGLWNVILTPNYNAAHDDHFHVDLTSGSDFLESYGTPDETDLERAWRAIYEADAYLGPAPGAE